MSEEPVPYLTRKDLGIINAHDRKEEDMNTKLWELKEMVEQMIEKHGENASLNTQVELKDPNGGACSYKIRLVVPQ